MNLDDLLRDTLSDDRWALPVPADTLSAVRRKRALRRRTKTVGAVLATAGIVTTAALTLPLAGSDHQVVLPGDGPTATLDPAVSLIASCSSAPAGRLAGSSYVVHSARDWFLTKDQMDAFYRTYREPSPAPDALVPSPQTSGPQTDHLLAALAAGGVPGADNLHRDEAQSGSRNYPELGGSLADGQGPLAVGRSHLATPQNIAGYYGSDTEDSSRDVIIEQVPGTDCVALLLQAHWPAPGESRPTFALVQVVTPSGLSTGWSSATISVAQLKTWAFATAQWETGHPTG